MVCPAQKSNAKVEVFVRGYPLRFRNSMYVNVDDAVTNCTEFTLWYTSFLLGLSNCGTKWVLIVLNVPPWLQPPL